MFNRKFKRGQAGSSTASCPPGKRRHILRQTSAGMKPDNTSAGVLLPRPAPFSLIAVLNHQGLSLTF